MFKELKARLSSGYLAVLSACQTHLLKHMLPERQVSLAVPILHSWVNVQCGVQEFTSMTPINSNASHVTEFLLTELKIYLSLPNPKGCLFSYCFSRKKLGFKFQRPHAVTLSSKKRYQTVPERELSLPYTNYERGGVFRDSNERKKKQPWVSQCFITITWWCFKHSVHPIMKLILFVILT